MEQIPRASSLTNIDPMFSALTQPNYPNAALGLRSDGVTALSLQKQGRGQYGIKQAATVSLPVGLLTPGFLDANISNQARGNRIANYLTERFNQSLEFFTVGNCEGNTGYPDRILERLEDLVCNLKCNVP